MYKYGILDDFDEVIRWTYDKPSNCKYVTIKIERVKKASGYELAMKNFEPALF